MARQPRTTFDYENVLATFVRRDHSMLIGPEERRRAVQLIRQWRAARSDPRDGVQTSLFDDTEAEEVYKRALKLLEQLKEPQRVLWVLDDDKADVASTATTEKSTAALPSANAEPMSPASSAITEAPLLPPPPPSNFEFVLSVFLSRSDREAIIGDLAEEYESYALPRFGGRKAAIWYRIQVIRSLLPLAWKRIRAIARWAAIADILQRVLSR